MDGLDRERELFDRAIGMRAADRATFLLQECAGNDALRARVDALLVAHEAAGGFMGSPTDGAAPTAAAPLREVPGTRIGPYKLLQLIGEGGFGSVFMAEQEQPIRRKVALKIIKLGMDTRQVVARFEQERQALALMDHPNIARVLDAGATETGRPFFVMELVKGEPIVEYCDKHNLSIHERLELFAQVCTAVQHAHTKGIIHRDIKPSNILVSTQDGRVHPKIIDFGVAKATSARLTEKTLFTEHRQLIGTPEYMSPEQAEGSLDIDTRTDVYSLGVLLYELLTGSTPFDSKSLRSAAYGEIQRMIREVEPPTPSTRLSEDTATIASVAAKRHTEPKQLGAIVRGELDWIVMRALEKDRSRRYETANGFGMDIRRYLIGDAVVAAPPSTSYRLLKFVRRHRRAVTATCIVAASLVLGMAGTAWQANRANGERDQAIAAQRKEAQARERAEAVIEFVTAALRAGDAHNVGGGQEVTILSAMDNAIKDIESGRFKNDPETEANLKTTIARILKNNGRVAQAERLYADVLIAMQKLHAGDHSEVATAMNNLGLARHAMGRYADAESMLAQAVAMYRRLHEGDDADVAMSLNNLAMATEALGQPAKAEPLYVQSLEMYQRLHPGDHASVAQLLNNVGYVYQALDRNADAEPLHVRALDMRRRLFKTDHPNVAESLNNLARVRQALKGAAAAEPLYREALEMFERLYEGDHPSVARCLSNYALVCQALNGPEVAEPLHERALSMNRRLFKEPNIQVAYSVNNLALAHLELGHAEESERGFAEALEVFRGEYRGDHATVAVTTQNLARARQALGRHDDARRGFDESVAMLRRLSPSGSPLLARVLWRSGSARLENKDATNALPELEEAVSLAEKRLPVQHPNLTEYRETLARCKEAMKLQAIERQENKFQEDR